jgi:hypothetical protein
MSNEVKQRKPRVKKAIEALPEPLETEPYNLYGSWKEETEHYNLQKLIYIYNNWNKLGDKVGKAFVNGEIVENDAFKTIVEQLIANCETTKRLWPYCTNEVRYRQNNELKSGRLIPTDIAIINMARPVRHTICEGLYQDLDVVNCHLYIYRYLCESNNIDCEYIDTYIEKRESILEDCVFHNPGSNRDDGKRWFLQVLNGGGKNPDKIQVLTPFMEKYFAELQTIHKKLSKIVDTTNPEFKQYIIKRDGKNVYNLDCKIVSKKLEDLENRMRHYICEFVKSKECDFSSHCYDGGMSYILSNPGPIKDIIKIDPKKPEKNECSRYVLQKTGITCPLKWKDFDEMIPIPQEELDKITIDDYKYIKALKGRDYNSIKIRFERHNFFINNDVKYCYEYEPENIVIEYSRDEFVKKYEDIWYPHKGLDKDGKEMLENKQFIKTWITDPYKRRCDKVVWVPESPKQKAELPPNVYNLWKGFKAEHITPDGKDHTEGVNTILYHLKYLVNFNESYYDYFLKWNARLYQYPSRKTEVCVGLKSLVQGVGKTTMFDLHTAIMGKQYTAKLENPERDMFGDFNELMYKRLFILLEECDYSTMSKFNKRFLDAVSAKIDNINIKGGTKMDVDSFTNYMAVWNTYGLKVPKEDRRVWANEICAEEKQPVEYFNKLFDAINNPQVQRAFYDYLMNVDLQEFNPSRDRPYTDLRAKMEEDSRDNIELYVRDLTIDWWRYNTGIDCHHPTYNYLNDPKIDAQTKFSEEMALRSNEKSGWLTGEYFLHFKNWIKSKGFNYHVDIRSFGKRLKAMKNPGIETYTSSGISKIRFNVSKSLDWCKQQKLITDEDLKDREIKQEEEEF